MPKAAGLYLPMYFWKTWTKPGSSTVDLQGQEIYILAPVSGNNPATDNQAAAAYTAGQI